MAGRRGHRRGAAAALEQVARAKVRATFPTRTCAVAQASKTVSPSRLQCHVFFSSSFLTTSPRRSASGGGNVVAGRQSLPPRSQLPPHRLALYFLSLHPALHPRTRGLWPSQPAVPPPPPSTLPRPPLCPSAAPPAPPLRMHAGARVQLRLQDHRGAAEAASCALLLCDPGSVGGGGAGDGEDSGSEGGGGSEVDDLRRAHACAALLGDLLARRCGPRIVTLD